MAGSAIVRTSTVIVVISALLVALTTPVRGQVADNKTYTVDVTDVAAGDADATIVLTIINTAANQDLGSANVVVPEPFVVGGVSVEGAEAHADLSAPALIELRQLGLAPRASVKVTIVVDVQSCVPTTPDPFEVAAKQSNTFNGTGNDFFLDPEEASDLTAEIKDTCGLAFAAQPGDAERGVTITATDYDPDGDPVAVEVVDAGDGEPATHATPAVTLTAANREVADPTLGGTTTATAVAGLATFDPGPTLAPSAFDYTLVATADFDGDGTDDASATSAPFDIVDDHVTCRADAPCPDATAERGGQEVTLMLDEATSGSRETSLVVSLGAADVPDFDCEGVPTDRMTAQYFLTGGADPGRTGRLLLTIPNAVPPVKAYEVCWAAPYDFATEDGLASTAEGTKPGADGAATTLRVGVLPDCARKGEPTRPCVADRSLKGNRSTATIEVLVDGRDPWARS